MCINHEIYHVVSCTNIVTIAEPINCHLCGCHGVKHEILQILQGLGRGEKCFCFHALMMAHLPTCGSSPRYKTTKENLKVGCANRAGGQAADQFVSITAHPLNVSNYLKYQHTHPCELVCNLCHYNIHPGSDELHGSSGHNLSLPD